MDLNRYSRPDQCDRRRRPFVVDFSSEAAASAPQHDDIVRQMNRIMKPKAVR